MVDAKASKIKAIKESKNATSHPQMMVLSLAEILPQINKDQGLVLMFTFHVKCGESGVEVSRASW